MGALWWYSAGVLYPASALKRTASRSSAHPSESRPWGSRAVEDSGTVTSVLVPWNTCGAYISGVLGVSTASYFPYCFFNFLSPILDVAYGFLGFKVPAAAPPIEAGAEEPRSGRRSVTPAGGASE